MTEEEYWSDCQLLSTEIDDALAVFFTYEEINRLALEDKRILNRLNADALFWKVLVHSLQTSLFIILGRIFDRGDDAHSIHKVLQAIDHSEYFSGRRFWPGEQPVVGRSRNGSIGLSPKHGCLIQLL